MSTKQLFQTVLIDKRSKKEVVKEDKRIALGIGDKVEKNGATWVVVSEERSSMSGSVPDHATRREKEGEESKGHSKYRMKVMTSTYTVLNSDDKKLDLSRFKRDFKTITIK